MIYIHKQTQWLICITIKPALRDESGHGGRQGRKYEKFLLQLLPPCFLQDIKKEKQSLVSYSGLL